MTQPLEGVTQIYEVEPTPGDSQGILVRFYNGDKVAELHGGLAMMIGLSFSNLMMTNPLRAHEYMAGVIAGLTHDILRGAFPPPAGVASVEIWGPNKELDAKDIAARSGVTLAQAQAVVGNYIEALRNMNRPA
jgi:hypothetical protein